MLTSILDLFANRLASGLWVVVTVERLWQRRSQFNLGSFELSREKVCNFSQVNDFRPSLETRSTYRGFFRPCPVFLRTHWAWPDSTGGEISDTFA